MVKRAIIWGFILWFIGYVLGIVLFFVLPPFLLGWVIMPIGIGVTVWVLLKKVHLRSIREYILLATIWVAIAVVCDYFLLVQVLKPADGYYKLDVYLYYLLTFALPILIGWQKWYTTSHHGNHPR